MSIQWLRPGADRPLDQTLQHDRRSAWAAMGSADRLPPGPARQARAGPGALRHPARHGLVARLHAHHPPGLLRAPLLRDAAAARLRAVARDRGARRASSCCTSPARSTPARPTSWVFKGSLQSCLEHDLPHEVLTGREITRALPRLPAAARDAGACSSPMAASWCPSAASSPMPRRRRRCGAEIHGRERVLRLGAARASGVRVHTDRGVYEADRLVITAGAWNGTTARLPARPGRARAPGAGLAPAARPGALRARALPGLQPAGRRRAATTASRSSRCRASSSAATTTSKRRRSRRGRPRAESATTRRCCATGPSATSPTAPGRR